jgi:uncharacterized protein YecT (DUF1311 family)
MLNGIIDNAENALEEAENTLPLLSQAVRVWVSKAQSDYAKARCAQNIGKAESWEVSACEFELNSAYSFADYVNSLEGVTI